MHKLWLIFHVVVAVLTGLAAFALGAGLAATLACVFGILGVNLIHTKKRTS